MPVEVHSLHKLEDGEWFINCVGLVLLHTILLQIDFGFTLISGLTVKDRMDMSNNSHME